jgi:hypothetical protein
MLTFFLPVVLLVAIPVIRALDLVSGVGRLNSGATQIVQFSLDTYSSTITSIVSSVSQGPNRTSLDSLPVNKIYGVNVSTRLTTFDTRWPHAGHSSATGSYLNHGNNSAHLGQGN